CHATGKMSPLNATGNRRLYRQGSATATAARPCLLFLPGSLDCYLCSPDEGGRIPVANLCHFSCCTTAPSGFFWSFAVVRSESALAPKSPRLELSRSSAYTEARSFAFVNSWQPLSRRSQARLTRSTVNCAWVIPADTSPPARPAVGLMSGFGL